ELDWYSDILRLRVICNHGSVTILCFYADDILPWRPALSKCEHQAYFDEPSANADFKFSNFGALRMTKTFGNVMRHLLT
ncbi:hypothetical protein COCCADRAFT_105947, partial [Bipolaris zeicola 26-R-13]